MFGSRLRIGLLVPMDNFVIEPELYALGIDGVSYHTIRLTTDERSRMTLNAAELASQFPELDVDVVVYACGETSALADNGTPLAVGDAIADAAGLPAVSATQALIEAARALGVQRVAVVTAYRSDRGREMERALQSAGLTVAVAEHRRFSSADDDGREWYATNVQSGEAVYELVRSLPLNGAEAVVITPTNLRSLDVLDRLEDDLGIPVISANQALLWWCLRERDLDAIVPGPGALLKGPAR